MTARLSFAADALELKLPGMKKSTRTTRQHNHRRPKTTELAPNYQIDAEVREMERGRQRKEAG